MTGIQLGMPWLEHPSQDVNDKGTDDVDACAGHEHRLSAQSQDNTTGKCSSFKTKQTCIRSLTPCLPGRKDLLSQPDFVSAERKGRMARQKR